MPIDYTKYTSPRLQDVYASNGGALPEGFDKGAFYKNFNISYDPRAYTDMGEAIRQWISAGRPDVDKYGNELDTRGQFITDGFGVPQWAQGNPNPAYSGGSPADSFLQTFASSRPWAQREVSNGGWDRLKYLLGTITQQDYGNYSPEDEAGIRGFLQKYGMAPSWMTGAPNAGAGVGRGAGQPTAAPGVAPNPAMRQQGTAPMMSSPRPTMAPTSGVSQIPGATSIPGAQVGYTPNGSAPNPATRQGSGVPTLGSFGGNRRPRGYEGY